MPDQNDTNTTLPPVDPTIPTASQDTDAPTPIIPNEAITAPADNAVPAPTPTDSTTIDQAQPMDNTGIINEVATKIGASHNILVALSSDPSVDELCSAIGLSLYLDRLGKRVTAIYSGATPNALEFLNPEETFEQSADTLQDFVIALNKEKADHLRYKLDGDYVKIFITPYKSRISNDDLEFSYGDYNVDLVLALDVANGVDLDAALREHGRIMHDATVVNITTGNPGKLGEIEWSDKTASSISEMIAELLYAAGGENKIEKEEATAFLTGIVAATNRFATAGTTSRTMELASRLMESGANQQLSSKNITSDMENEFFSPMNIGERVTDNDPTKLDIAHGDETEVDENKEVETPVTEKESTLLDDLKAAEASLAASVSGVVTPEEKTEPLKLPDEPSIEDSLKDLSNLEGVAPDNNLPQSNVVPETENTPSDEIKTESNIPSEIDITAPESEETQTEIVSDDQSEALRTTPEKVVDPLDNFVPEPLGEGTNKYGQMLEDALSEMNSEDKPSATMPTMEEPQVTSPPEDSYTSSNNPAISATPNAPTEPEINGVPEIDYMPPMPGDETLPPPPTPPIDFNSAVPTAEPISATEGTIPSVPKPIIPDLATSQETTQIPPEPTPVSASQPQGNPATVHDPAAFKIPGM